MIVTLKMCDGMNPSFADGVVLFSDENAVEIEKIKEFNRESKNVGPRINSEGTNVTFDKVTLAEGILTVVERTFCEIVIQNRGARERRADNVRVDSYWTERQCFEL